MSRPQTKQDLIRVANAQFNKLWQVISSMDPTELETLFDFSSLNKKEAHWTRDKDLKDVLVHLYEWHQLLIRWIQANGVGKNQPFLPEPYNWRNYGALNQVFWHNHQATSLEKAKALLLDSHEQVMDMISEFTDEELFGKGYFKWVGKTSLGSYCVSATSSHYDWAIRKLKAHQKICRSKSISE
ncbi:ClbS/DfsB family four-helix bundle protein [Aerococcaceae bacterium NML180378]|nr:ClbS/DfsB family four-helix bundle protein [Aerococcaceae bacterium NML180378]